MMTEADTAAEQRSVEKWGEAGRAGFQVLPDLLLKRQVELGLSVTDVVVLINITMHWWYAHQRPFPRSTTIAERMGVDKRTVQRSLRKLSDLGLVRKVSETAADGSERLVCDLSGLVARLEEFAKGDLDYKWRQLRRMEREGGFPTPF
jgi:DNA replication protein DnaD